MAKPDAPPARPDQVPVAVVAIADVVPTPPVIAPETPDQVAVTDVPSIKLPDAPVKAPTI